MKRTKEKTILASIHWIRCICIRWIKIVKTRSHWNMIWEWIGWWWCLDNWFVGWIHRICFMQIISRPFPRLRINSIFTGAINHLCWVGTEVILLESLKIPNLPCVRHANQPYQLVYRNARCDCCTINFNLAHKQQSTDVNIQWNKNKIWIRLNSHLTLWNCARIRCCYCWWCCCLELITNGFSQCVIHSVFHSVHEFFFCFVFKLYSKLMVIFFFRTWNFTMKQMKMTSKSNERNKTNQLKQILIFSTSTERRRPHL